jgi:hypothetical protein
LHCSHWINIQRNWSNMTALFELLISLWNLWTKIEQKVKCPHLHTYVLCYSKNHINFAYLHPGITSKKYQTVYQDNNVLKWQIIKQLSLYVLEFVVHIKCFEYRIHIHNLIVWHLLINMINFIFQRIKCRYK